MAQTEQILAQADRAFVEEDFEAAVKGYSQALALDASNARIYESRAHALIKLEQWLEANGDATRAIELDPSLVKAYLRKGVALFHLDEFEAAKEALDHGAPLAGDSGPLPAQFKTWLRKCAAELEDESKQSETSATASAAQAAAATVALPAAPAPAPVPAPAPAPAPSVPSLPAPPMPCQAQPAPQPQPLPQPTSAAAASIPLAPAAAGAQPQTGKYRYQHYQLANKVTVDVYAKRLKKEQVVCEFSEQHLLLAILDAEGQEEFKLDMELYGQVSPSQCKCEVLSTKVEVTLVKADTTAWPTLERSDLRPAAQAYVNPPADNNYPSAVTGGPVKPYTSRKDWSKVEADLKVAEEKGELDDGDPLNSFFKKIFAQGDEDTRRAMMKSFQESNGTVLSTNWKEVGAKKIECTPPDGMEVKQWGKD